MDPNPQPVKKTNDAEKKRRSPNRHGDASWKTYSEQWKQNHGTLLMIFAAAVVLSGFAVLAFQQNRFRKPAFSSSQPFTRSAEATATDAFRSTDVSAGELTDASPTDGPAWRLKIVGEIAADKPDGGGLIRIAVYASSNHFNQPEFAIWKTSLTIEPAGDLECNVPVDHLPPTFAIAAFQDTNENGSLDRNALGTPTERYGFSNSARGKIGPPGFDEAVVDRPVDGGELELKIW